MSKVPTNKPDVDITALIILNPTLPKVLEQLPACLNSLDFCEKIYVIADPITPELEVIASDHHAHIFPQKGDNFAAWRNSAIKHVTTDWILFVDHDEQVPPELESEIIETVSSTDPISGYAIPRLNHILGTPMRHAGWYPDYVLRLIKVSDFVSYEGKLHEQPQLKGLTGHLTNHFLHYKHDNLEDMLSKTNKWSNTEAELLYDSKHPPMISRRFIQPFVSEVFTRLIRKQGYLDGTPGFIDAIYQGYSRLITYVKLWELQQTKK